LREKIQLNGKVWGHSKETFIEELVSRVTIGKVIQVNHKVYKSVTILLDDDGAVLVR